MGLFDFVRDIGNKAFGSHEEAGKKIKAEIESANPGVSNLDVQYEPQSGTVTLAGNAESAAAMQKAVLMAGNVEGVSQVEAAGLQHPPEQERVEYYVIERGDTLSKIAQQFYGDANQYPRIFEANREVIKDADRIFPGQKLRIPLE
jgi:nucleoid-associated protein YgaU